MRFAFQLIKHREHVKFITKTNIRYYSTTFVFIYTISGWEWAIEVDSFLQCAEIRAGMKMAKTK